MLNGGTIISDVSEDITFHKLCLPLSVGFTVNIWKLQPSIFVGYRPNYFLSGKYYSKSVFNHSIDSLDMIGENTFNPLDASDAGWPVKHFNNQFFYGFSTFICQHFKISITINSGNEIYFSQEGGTCLPYFFYNNDYAATVTYLFQTSRKKNSIK
jgi:hypothetical protein